MTTAHPLYRPRRLRRSTAIRQMVQENFFSLNDLIHPIFIEEGLTEAVQLKTLPGVYRYPETDLAKEVKELADLGIKYIMPFGISHHKDAIGSDTWKDEGLLVRMIRTIREAAPEMVIIPDICFCEYTDHGHCGVLCEHGHVKNDETIENLARQAVAAAKAGADMLAPSAMMDGQIAAMREALDAAGYEHVGILAHAIKFASAFYGPFREAVNSELSGNRNEYQADYANGRTAMIEAELDEAEGADILMVKPGTPYLDLVARLRQQTNLPVAVYQVGGEYAAIKFASMAGALDEKAIVKETMIGFKRAGADVIVSYYTKQIAEWLREGEIDSLSR
ncbi:porphobilinogen synthase [Wohlfahrtiimonas chitiniclastica]|uniref:Delta-aminolevulinic acid dehydratase n=1 Tax=Wohlfahrtiimonas chitiniclastica SH04 TaxID=1261130 RepID=L8XXQ2_9GAMM|nr:porphobilinogen synthase [Wohlfahrtiimonas chitiniclastica]ELV08702.1 Delta-aminolevulinic acid dehydratase [Wohlfahrtiimonas chitiniclastica SH04]KZS22359.1 delta-aminolevulinic acid dehydratase [Wohlfahrtiimonas chitiniclastica]MBS7816300.1 porphobilinogen synthase [Wohlfahrtiimonas chitiniclastica]MBS7821705.1 porphobilinogen synthase [Wohlfahrtiimonas chitiniclastica]MBS7829497.1 porphobilinogen synthase [Wohlfahrtiimonas chitiniclastica]